MNISVDIPAKIKAEALQWHMLLSGPEGRVPSTSKIWIDFEAWCNRDGRHALAYQQLANLVT